MQVARGPVEYLRPVNAGLLFFNREPHLFFPRAWIQLAIHQDELGRSFVSQIFKGPLHYQIEQCLSYLKAHVLRKSTVKVPGQAAANVFENWPFEVLEEVVVNAVYHKSYQDQKPIEIQVFPDRIF
jgi:ATP-dependent DNA helicase RecG